jgi:spermidine synthase
VKNLVLLVVAFLSGAILMALELTGSRLLAPYFGGSIFVWGSLIGVFLIALSIGYYLGGRLVDRWPGPGLLAAFLLAAGLLVLVMPRYGPGICDRVSRDMLSVRAGSLLACLALFLLPGALMAVTSPYVVRLTARTVEGVGRTAGAVYAVSTIGSIAGTLGTAFYLIPAIGTRALLHLLGGLLVFTSLLAAAAKSSRRGLLAPVALALLLAPRPASAEERVLYERDSPYHRLLVTEDGTYRWLRADNIWHSQMNLKDPHGRGLAYTDYADLAFLFNPAIRRVLVIGLGGGTIPKRFVRDYPQLKVEAVEIDPDVVKIAARYFYVSPGPRLAIHESDGRLFLRRSKATWDLIVLDAYYADSVPFFLTTREFFKLAREHLSPGGLIVNNVVASRGGARSKFFRSIYRTMKETFPQVHAFQVRESGSQAVNIEVFAVNSTKQVSRADLLDRATRARNAEIKDPALLGRLANYLGTSIATGDVPVLSDDYAPVDALLHLW